MKYSVCIDALFMNKGSFTEAMEKVKHAGYQAIEFWTWWDKDIMLMEKKKKELGLEIAAFCTKFINPGDPDLQQEYITGLRESIEAAKRLECDTLIAQAGWEFDSFAKEITRNQHRRCLIDTMQKAAAIMEKENMTLVIEPLNTLVNHPGYHLSTSEDSFDVIDRIGSDHVKILFDIYHQQITEGNLIQNITDNIQKIGHFHAAGNPGRNEITKGEIHYKNVFQAIKNLSYEHYIGLEYMVPYDPVEGLVEAKNKILV